MIVILDYGMGNAGSILNMVRKAGGEAIISASKSAINDASAVILPGVGAFDNGMAKLRQLDLVETLTNKVVTRQTPFLGVCLGMQLVFERSDEGSSEGLGWLKGSVKRFDFSSVQSKEKLKVPHMGWNLVHPHNYNSLFAGLEEEARFYFVHSYHVKCSDTADILAHANYGFEFTCAVQRGNIFGAQFHAEKSHRFGLTLFKNFLKQI